MKNASAVALGSLSRGIKRKLSEEERRKRALRLARVRIRRWPKNGD